MTVYSKISDLVESLGLSDVSVITSSINCEVCGKVIKPKYIGSNFGFVKVKNSSNTISIKEPVGNTTQIPYVKNNVRHQIDIMYKRNTEIKKINNKYKIDFSLTAEASSRCYSKPTKIEISNFKELCNQEDIQKIIYKKINFNSQELKILSINRFYSCCNSEVHFFKEITNLVGWDKDNNVIVSGDKLLLKNVSIKDKNDTLYKVSYFDKDNKYKFEIIDPNQNKITVSFFSEREINYTNNYEFIKKFKIANLLM